MAGNHREMLLKLRRAHRIGGLHVEKQRLERCPARAARANGQGGELVQIEAAVPGDVCAQNETIGANRRNFGFHVSTMFSWGWWVCAAAGYVEYMEYGYGKEAHKKPAGFCSFFLSPHVLESLQGERRAVDSSKVSWIRYTVCLPRAL